VVLEELSLTEIGTVRMSRIRLTLKCARCGAGNEVSFRSPADDAEEVSFSGGCERCMRAFAVTATFPTAHVASSVVARVSVANASPFDCHNPDLSATCLPCSAALSFPSAVVGRAAERNCRECHTKMSLRFESISLHRSAVSASVAAALSKANREVGAMNRQKLRKDQSANGVGLVLNTPLVLIFDGLVFKLI
jgi:hypothetical protein